MSKRRESAICKVCGETYVPRARQRNCDACLETGQRRCPCKNLFIPQHGEKFCANCITYLCEWAEQRIRERNLDDVDANALRLCIVHVARQDAAVKDYDTYLKPRNEAYRIGTWLPPVQNARAEDAVTADATHRVAAIGAVVDDWLVRLEIAGRVLSEFMAKPMQIVERKFNRHRQVVHRMRARIQLQTADQRRALIEYLGSGEPYILLSNIPVSEL